MEQAKIDKLRRRLEKLRARSANIRPEELARLAEAVGRRPHKRGKEPTFVSDRQGWFPLSIPHHPGALKKGTAISVLNQLEDDLLKLEEELGESETTTEELDDENEEC